MQGDAHRRSGNGHKDNATHGRTGHRYMLLDYHRGATHLLFRSTRVRGGTMQKGDLIYNSLFKEYAIVIGKSDWTGWIRVVLVSTGERTQVNDAAWEIV